MFNLISDRLIRSVVTLAIGMSGSTATDPAFGTHIIRVTDQTMGGHSYRTPSSEQQVAVSHNGTRFYTTRTDGQIDTWHFDGVTGKCSHDRVLPFGIEPSFSQVDDDIIYGAVGSQVRLYHFSTSAWTVLADPATDDAAHFGVYLGGTVQSSATVERVVYFYGGASQDHHYRVAVLDPVSHIKHIVDTLAQTLDGVSLPDAFNGGVNVHAVAIDRSGRYVVIYPPGEDLRHNIQGFSQTNGKFNTYVWNVDTGVVFPITWTMHPYGHSAFGYGTFVNQDNNALLYDGVQYQIRSLSDVAHPIDLINPVLTPKEVAVDGHPNWNNASSTSSTWFVDGVEPYYTSTTNTTRRAWDYEIVLFPTAPGGPVYRVCHYRSAIENPDGTIEFWSTPRPQISPDGRWVWFTSNWERTLGKDSDGTDRQDVFIVRTSRGQQVAAPRVFIRGDL